MHQYYLSGTYLLVFVAGSLHKTYLTGNAEMAHQVSKKHKGSIEHTHEMQFPSLVILRYFTP